jgi:hypothetical protein
MRSSWDVVAVAMLKEKDNDADEENSLIRSKYLL